MKRSQSDIPTLLPIPGESVPLSTESRFLIACCQAESTPEEIDYIRDTLRDLTVDIRRLPTLAGRQGILPSVYRTLRTLHERNLLPDTPDADILLEEMKRLYLSIARRNMLISAELLRLVKLFREYRIDALALKGPALAQIAYGDITLRQYGDLDILIHRKDFEKIADLMRQKGYTPFYPIEKFTGDKVLFEMNNDCPFYDRERSLSVEIHWDFFRKLALPTACFRPWEATESVTINGVAIDTLNKETHLLYHSLHGSKHIWERMGWIVDIDRFIRNVPGLDWEIMIERARRLGALRMFLFGPALAQYFFDTPLPSSVSRLCEREDYSEMIRFVIEEYEREDLTPEESLVKLSKVIGLRDNLYYKTLTLLEFLFRPGINERRSVILSDRWFWLYWLLRPLGMGYRFLFCRTLKLCKTEKK